MADINCPVFMTAPSPVLGLFNVVLAATLMTGPPVGLAKEFIRVLTYGKTQMNFLADLIPFSL